jgi:hypothetical protein
MRRSPRPTTARMLSGVSARQSLCRVACKISVRYHPSHAIQGLPESLLSIPTQRFLARMTPYRPLNLRDQDLRSWTNPIGIPILLSFGDRASTAFPTSTSPASCLRSMHRRCPDERSSPTSAAGQRMGVLSGGRSVATSMGSSPLSGLVMGIRPGDLDPVFCSG